MDTRLITNSSRIGSIGGLVTCAKFCLKYVNSSFGLSDSAEIGVSLPIEPIASSPVVAIGVIRNFRSSWNLCNQTSAGDRAVTGSRSGFVRSSGQFFQHNLRAREPFPCRDDSSQGVAFKPSSGNKPALVEIDAKQHLRRAGAATSSRCPFPGSAGRPFPRPSRCDRRA